MSKRVTTVSIDDVIASIETARDKVMADEVKSLVKLGLPKSVAYKMVAERYRQRSESDEGEEAGGSPVARHVLIAGARHTVDDDGVPPQRSR